jgi:photosystem II stability/assembly factor-like uncharacterized protein
MTPEDNELRRALEARSGAASPEFRSRLSQALRTRPAAPSLMPAIAFATAVVLTATSVGILVAARQLGRSNHTVASGARTESPSPLPPGGFNFQLSAPSADVVWALYDPDKLYRSTDGGSSWQIRSMPSEFGVHAKVSFIDDLQGWWLASGSPATQCQDEVAAVWHTVDAGATWQKLPATGIGPSQCKDGIWFFDRKHGFVTAHDLNNRPTVYRTADGGNTWAATTLQDPAYFKSAPGGFTLQVRWMKQFGSSTYMEVFGSQDDPNLPHDNQFILKSTDGGASWTLVTKVPSQAIVMVTESRWLDFTIQGQAMESTNGGQQFHQFASNYAGDPPKDPQLLFADSQVGFASGPGYLLRTIDGGSQWTRLAPPGATVSAPSPSASPSSIPMPSDAVLSAPSANAVWALVASQYLFRSIDQGSTWEQRSWAVSGPRGGGHPLIAFVDDTNGWAMFPGLPATQCSQQGVQIWRTTDGAKSWQLVAAVDGNTAANGLAFDQCKDVIYFADATHGFVGAEDSTGFTVWRTADGGLTWSATRLPNPPGFTPGGGSIPITSIKAFGDGSVLAYAEPYVFESNNGGATWTYLNQTPESQSREIEFVTPTRWLKIQGNLETTDAGKTWHAFTHTDEEAAGVYSTFVFATDKVGYATVRGDIRRTVDGGANFVLIKGTWP